MKIISFIFFTLLTFTSAYAQTDRKPIPMEEAWTALNRACLVNPMLSKLLKGEQSSGINLHMMSEGFTQHYPNISTRRYKPEKELSVEAYKTDSNEFYCDIVAVVDGNEDQVSSFLNDKGFSRLENDTVAALIEKEFMAGGKVEYPVYILKSLNVPNVGVLLHFATMTGGE